MINLDLSGSALLRSIVDNLHLLKEAQEIMLEIFKDESQPLNADKFLSMDKYRQDKINKVREYCIALSVRSADVKSPDDQVSRDSIVDVFLAEIEFLEQARYHVDTLTYEVGPLGIIPDKWNVNGKAYPPLSERLNNIYRKLHDESPD